MTGILSRLRRNSTAGLVMRVSSVSLAGRSKSSTLQISGGSAKRLAHGSKIAREA